MDEDDKFLLPIIEMPRVVFVIDFGWKLDDSLEVMLVFDCKPTPVELSEGALDPAQLFPELRGGNLRVPGGILAVDRHLVRATCIAARTDVCALVPLLSSHLLFQELEYVFAEVSSLLLLVC